MGTGVCRDQRTPQTTCLDDGAEGEERRVAAKREREDRGESV